MMTESEYHTFLKELEKEVEYHQSGTTYRLRTAEMGLSAAKEWGRDTDYSNREHVLKLVRQLHPNEDDERARDIAKFLSVLNHHLRQKRERAPEVQAYLDKKKENRKGLRFK